MATLVYIDRQARLGRRVQEALDDIRTGIGVLQELNGLRAEAIGSGAPTMGSAFGIADNDQAQDFSNRWDALLAAYGDAANPEFFKLRDLLNATFDD